MVWSFPHRPAGLVGDTAPLHAQSEALRCRHHGAGPRLHSHHGRAAKAARVRPERILHLQVYPDRAYTCTVSIVSTHFCFKVNWCVDYLGFASRRNLYICVAAAHPPGGSRGEDGVGEGGGGAGGGAGRPALQCTLSGGGRRRGPRVSHIWELLGTRRP